MVNIQRSQNNNVLLVDLYELTMAQVYFEYKPDARATFELFIRDMPPNRSYLVAAGLQDILKFIKELKFNEDAIQYLKTLHLFSDKFLTYLKSLKFSGDIWALPEGEIFFANEPILRVTANIIEAQILESFFLNTINLQTMIASKASRVVCVSRGKSLFDFSLRRTQGRDAAIKVARSAYLAGFAGTSNLLAGKLYNIPVVGTMAHSFVMSFENELDSFLAYSRIFPDRTIILVDTYDTLKGIDNAVQVGLHLKKKRYKLSGIRLDSGNLVTLSRAARRKLDKAGLRFVKIFASGNLDEYKISEILRKGALIDSFGVGTHMGTSSDSPCLDVIYKLSEITHGERFLPTMKLSRFKVTYPGRKQIFRLYNKSGTYIKDVLGLEDERIKGARPLLRKVVEKGEVIYHIPRLEESRKMAKSSLQRLPAAYKKFTARAQYPVVISPKLKRVTLALTKDLKSRQKEKKTLFFDVDTQYDFMCRAGRLYVKGADKITGNLKVLTEFADKNNITVISSLDTHIKNDPEFKMFPAHCVKNTAGYKKITQTLAGNTEQIFIEKRTFDAFSNPRTKQYIKPFDTAYVYGVATDYCVKAACLGLVKAGLKVYLVKDAIKAVTKKGERDTLRLLKAKGVILVATREVVKNATV